MSQRNSPVLPSDPLFTAQWHLMNTGQVAGAVPGQDINVRRVWSDYTGQGVWVAVMDDGFDEQHPDLVANYASDLSWDLNLNRPGAQAVGPEDNHGTAVAGLVAARANNGIGGVGVAGDAHLIGYRGLADNTADLASFFTQAVTRLLNAKADISSNSWGPMASPFDDQVDQPSYQAAVSRLVTEGRAGLGVITLFSAGNDRQSRLNTNYDPTDNLPYAIVVAASKADGQVTSYSTPGASVLVTAPGSDPASIVTTDRQGTPGYNPLAGTAGDYTNTPSAYFDGTSAAAPIAAGVVALMLQANPNLGYRDVQEILVYSARRAVFLETPGVQSTFNQALNWNGGGLMTHDDYGFGNIDAHAAVRLAESWQKTSTVANLERIDGAVQARTLLVEPAAEGLARALFTQSNRLEQITVTVDLQTDRLEAITLELISPGGTRSLLIDRPPIINDDDGNPIDLPDRLTYTLNTARSWGESLAGEWTLRLANTADGAPVRLNDWSIQAHASDASIPVMQVFTDELANFAALDRSRQTIKPDQGRSINATAVTQDVVLDFSAATVEIGGLPMAVVDPGLFLGLLTGDGDDRLVGNEQDNWLMGGRGNNRIDGGLGHDTALYMGTRSGYSVDWTPAGVEISASRLAGGGVDQVLNVESFRFGSTELLAKSALNQTQTVGSFYDALFNRAADADGLRFWADAYWENGVSEIDIALNFTRAPEDGVASLTTEAFLTRLYHYALERAPDQAGFEFWLQALQTEQINRGQALLNFVQSAEFIDNRLDTVAVQVSALGDIWS